MNLQTSNVFAGMMLDILEHPEDDVPRLILADYLEDHAEAEHDRIGVDVIRRQISDPGWMPWDADGPLRDWYMEQTRWVCQLFSRPSCGMSEPKPEGYIGIKIDRGFIGELSLLQQDWLNAGPAIVRMAPICRVVIEDFSPLFVYHLSGRKYASIRAGTSRHRWRHEVDHRIWPFIGRGAAKNPYKSLFHTIGEASDDVNCAALEWARHCAPVDLDSAVKFAQSRLPDFSLREVKRNANQTKQRG